MIHFDFTYHQTLNIVKSKLLYIKFLHNFSHYIIVNNIYNENTVHKVCKSYTSFKLYEIALMQSMRIEPLDTSLKFTKSKI